ncbi:MAG: DUF3343 domain-containing protein [Actinobacteria bacterium]|nr:DUF3343 domain-containing protein [Actinomycetota bacterium]
MNDFNCYVVLFHSTHHALSAEKVLKHMGIGYAVINTPREFSVDCGISLRINPADAAGIREALEAAGVAVAGVEPYRSRWAGGAGGEPAGEREEREDKEVG